MVLQNKKENRFCPLCFNNIKVDDLLYLKDTVLICWCCFESYQQQVFDGKKRFCYNVNNKNKKSRTNENRVMSLTAHTNCLPVGSASSL